MVIKNIHSKRDNGIGQIFTPSYIAEFMVKNLNKFITKHKKEHSNLKILEPSVGEGIFLKYLLRYKFSDITAYEMDDNLKDTLLNSYPNINFKFENFLGSNPNEKFDIIIGNPPYLGQNYNAKTFQEYVKMFPICQKYFAGNMDLFYFFIHLGIEKLNPGGFITFITTNYWITKSKNTGIKLLKPHVLGECFLLQYIDLSHLKLFESAKGQQNCIFVLQKKEEQEKISMKNKNIEVIQIFEENEYSQNSKSSIEELFRNLSSGKILNNIKRFTSAITNNDLKKDESWNLIYPNEVKYLVDKIESYCLINGKISLLKDYFLIRNGLILIKDSIFILNEGKNLKIKNNEFYIRINGEFLKLSKAEKSRLKKIYKSKSIKTYGYDKDGYEGYVIYFNKNEFNSKPNLERNQQLKIKYPILSKYIRQFEKNLKDILINAKENPENFYFPRRGSYIRQFEGKNKGKLTDLEQLYDCADKIFFKFISKENKFGYTNTPYYATSDTYFLWKKYPDKEIDYLFILAYLNSKIVTFLFHAKNISIKRSKTKLEQGLPIPNINNFKKEKKAIIELIKILSSYLIWINNNKNNYENRIFIENIQASKYFIYYKKIKLEQRLIRSLENYDLNNINIILDELFFKLFNLDGKLINKLLNQYYRL
ncbi:MAG: Eco57I restriction-modification methylase domain-containing protein [Candidatus Thorarchaeota archaeon]